MNMCLCGEVLKLFSMMCVFTQRHCDIENKSAAHFCLCCSRMNSCTLKKNRGGGEVEGG